MDYKVVDVHQAKDSSKTLEDVLNKWARAGWELVQIHNYPTDTGNQLTVVFKAG